MLSSRSIFLRRSVACVNSHYNQSPLLLRLNDEFKNYLPKIVENSLKDKKYADFTEIKHRIAKMSEYHTLAREPIQGKLTLLAFSWLASPGDLTEQNLHQIKVLAWAIELLQSYFLIGDDVDDKCKTRCGKPCWHLLPEVGSFAYNDACLLRSFIYEILRNNIEDKLLLKTTNYFNETFTLVNFGQYLDIKLCQSKNFNEYTIEQYNKLMNYKTSFYNVKFPILLALAVCNKDNTESYQIVDQVCTDLGIVLQIQNDLMDYINYKSVSVKSSTDIENGKCSWPVVVALQHSNPWQLRELKTCYGRWEPEKVERILNLYKELNLPLLYRQEEDKRFQAVTQKIGELPTNSTPSPHFFHQLVEFIRPYTANIAPSC